MKKFKITYERIIEDEDVDSAFEKFDYELNNGLLDASDFKIFEVEDQPSTPQTGYETEKLRQKFYVNSPWNLATPNDDKYRDAVDKTLDEACP